MEDDVFMSGFGRANQQQQSQEYPLYTDTVGIFVDPGWGSSSQTGIQLCPALFISSAANIPKAVKHIYSRLAAAASEVDQGVPHLLLSLVGTGNSFSFENSDRLVRGLAHLVGRCALWLISSGEQNDPLAVAITAALRSTLAGHSSSSDSSGMGAEEEEILLMVVNSADVRHVGVSSPPAASPARPMADARLNTLYLVWAQSGPSEKQMLLFRACTAVKLANPPPALLIGVPEERSSATGLGPFLSQAQTPIGGPSNSPAILLPSIGPSAERRPLPLVLFCGATLGSLVELLAYVQCGVPALVVQDISELCVVLKAAFLLFQSAGFEHAAFEFWLGRELRMVALATTGHCTKSDLEEAKQMLCQLLLTVSTSEHSLLAFMPARELDKLGEQALDLLVRSASDVNDLGRGLELAVKIGQPRTLNSIRLEGLLSEEQLAGLLRAALIADDRLEVLSALLDQNMPLRVGSDLLMGWLADTRDQYFFSAIILGHCLGMPPGQLKHLDASMAREFSRLMGQLCGGVSQCLFPVESFSASPGSQSMAADPERGLRLLAVWALLLHRPQLVLLCCAYSPEPMALCLALAKAARTLANRSQAWIFYEQSLRRLGHQLTQFAVQLLDTAYRQDATKAYAALCRPLPAFRHLTLPQLAFETNCRDFIAHECCQRWLLRLLYGRIQIRAVWRHFCLPNWLKILLSALLVWPIAIWIRPRLEKAHGNAGKGMMGSRRPISPTVALLEDGRLEKKVQRSSSVRSGHFGGSGHLVGDPRRHSTTMGDALQQHLANGAAGVEADAVHQGTNDDSTLTDSFLPSASQMREEGGGGGRSSRAADLDGRRHRGEQQREAETILLMQQQRPTGSRRQSPDRRSLMFFGDGASGGGDSFTGRQRRRSRASSSRLLALNATDGPGQHSGAFSPAGGARLCPSSLLLFYSTPITKFWLYLAFRLLYLLLMGLAVVQAGCFLSGWPEQLLWLWALCWLLDSAWVLTCRAQLGDWRQHGWAIFDLVACTAFLLSLLGMRISGPSGYVLRALWALFLLFECHKTVFLFAPLSPVLGPMLVRIRLMLTRDLVNFLLLCLPLVAASAVAIKATLYPDLSPQPPQMAESFGWTLRQLFTTDLDVLHQSAECQRQLLPERRPFCQALGGYANPRCPAQHWLASFTLFHFLLFVKLLCWPILFALFARTARRVEEEAEQLWRFQLYALATGFSLRPCLPPPLTPLFLVLLACCRFGTGGLSCLLQQRGGINSSDGAGMTSSDHPDVADHGPPHGANRKFSTVYRNPSVLPARGRPLSGYWRRLAIGLWKASHPVKSTQSSAQNPADLHAQTHQQSDKLLLGFHALRQQLLEKEGRQSWEEQEMDSTPETEEKNANSPPPRLKIRPQCRPWLHLLPDYRPNWHSQPADQFPSDMQKYVDDCSAQGLLDLAGQWRQRRLDNFFALADDWTHRQQAGMSGGVLLSGKGLPLNPRGRTGLAGRGSLARFGPNRMFFYAIFRQKAAGGDVQVLVQQPSGQLPSRWALSSGRPMVDEFLAQLLLQLGLPDPEIHALSSKTALSPGQRDGSVAQLDIDENGSEKPLLDNSAQETDNAWVERRLWAVNLSGFSQLHQLAEGGELAWVGGHRLSQTAERRFLDKAVAAFGKQEGEMAMAEES